jgi:hypothetical protein
VSEIDQSVPAMFLRKRCLVWEAPTSIVGPSAPLGAQSLDEQRGGCVKCSVSWVLSELGVL